LAVCAWIVLPSLTTQAASSSELDALMKQSAQNYQTKEGDLTGNNSSRQFPQLLQRLFMSAAP
jgi:hypothetical protein